MRSTLNTLTGRQRRWLEAYLIHGNATRAAREAGYSTPEKAGPRLRHNEKMIDAIEAALAEQVMTRNEALARLSSQARADYSHFLKTADDQLVVDLPALLAAGLGHLIKAIRHTEHGQQITFYDAQTALIWVGKHHRLFADVIKNDTTAELEAALDALNQSTRLTL